MLSDYFWRAARPQGTAIVGAAGNLRQGALISCGADVSEGCLQRVGFRVVSCPHIIAACNWLAEELEGAPIEALHELPLAELQLMFDIPVEKAGKLLILQDAAQACYAQYRA